MDTEMIVAVACFALVIVVIAIVLIVFLRLGRKLEGDYITKLQDKTLLDAMDKDTIFERMVSGGRVMQYVTILGAFSAIFFLAVIDKISAEIAGTIIGMIITGVIGAEAGARFAGESKKKPEITETTGAITPQPGTAENPVTK